MFLGIQLKNESSAGAHSAGRLACKDPKDFAVKQKSDLLKLAARLGLKTVLGMNIRKKEQKRKWSTNSCKLHCSLYSH